MYKITEGFVKRFECLINP